MLKEFRPVDWCFDPYAKHCDRCETVVGRYGVMIDDQGLRQVLFWPMAAWDGQDGGFRCKAHSTITRQWSRLF